MKTRLQLEADRTARLLRANMAEDLRRLREDAGVPQRTVAALAGVAQPYLSRIESGASRPTLETYLRIAAALGADVAFRPYPRTGPPIRDRHQARILDALLGQLHPRWRAYPEVPVRAPARGSIDLVLHDTRDDAWVAGEVESVLRRIEQQLRWGAAKAASLPSWSGWPRSAAAPGAAPGPGSAPRPPPASRLLVIRATRETRGVARELGSVITAAFPYSGAAALDALRGAAPWPGAALVWARIDGTRVTFLDH